MADQLVIRDKDMVCARIPVWVKPNSQRSEIAGFQDECLIVRVAAPAEKGKANKELVAFLAQLLNVARGDITILAGSTARRKLLGIAGLGKEEAIRRLCLKKQA